MSQYPLDRRLGGPQSRSGRGGEEKNSQPPPGLELDISHKNTSLDLHTQVTLTFSQYLNMGRYNGFGM
jgi:hypothetical protein